MCYNMGELWNQMLRERSQKHKATYYMIHLYEIPGMAESIETENRLVFV